MRFASSVVSGLTLLGSAIAHPGHDIQQEIQERRDFLSSIKRTDLSHCAEKLRARGIEKRNIERRAAQVNKARAKRQSNLKTIRQVLTFHRRLHQTRRCYRSSHFAQCHQSRVLARHRGRYHLLWQ